MNKELPSNKLTIIAGPCSVDTQNIHQIHQIGDILSPDGRPAIWGTRVVGVKSRTENSETGEGMGIDYPALIKAQEGSLDYLPPSVAFARDVVKKTGLVVACEVMLPEIQMNWYAGILPDGKGLFWNPAVMQLGFQIGQMSRVAHKYGWYLGIKNGKTLGTSLDNANNPTGTQTPLEKTWKGLTTFAPLMENRVALIHRGVEVPEKGRFRSALVHEIARRVKQKTQHRLFFDPSHSLGPDLRDDIIKTTVEAMKMREGSGFLYDGILIEAGDSQTDTKQHITLDELRDLVNELSAFRNLNARDRQTHDFYMSA